MVKSIKASHMEPGMMLALPMNKTATVTEVKLGHKFVNFKTEEYGPSRVLRDDEILIEETDNGPDDQDYTA